MRGRNTYEEAKIQGRLWTPKRSALSGLVALYDAAETGSLILGSTGTVTSWADSSRNGNATLAGGGLGGLSAPTWTPFGVGTGPAVVFSGAQVIQAGTTFTVPTVPFSIFTLGYCSSYSGAQTFACLGRDTSGVGSAMASVNLNHFLGYDSSTNRVGTATLVGGVPAMFLSSHGTSAPRHTLRTQGRDDTVGTETSNIVVARSSLTIGSFISDGIPGTPFFQLNGRVACVAIFQGALLNPAIHRLEGWAAHKWGCRTILPASHPYCNTPPMLDN